MAVFLGANGTGKSTFFDVFRFLSDALRNNVKTAINNRGGFKEVITRNETGDIEFELKFRNSTDQAGEKSPLITYFLQIGLEGSEVIVKKEQLKYRRGQHGQPWLFLDFEKGEGMAITNEEAYQDQHVEAIRDSQKLDAPNILAIKGLGQFQKFKAVSGFRKLLENWYIANFQIPDAKRSQEIGVAEHLSTTGDNLALVADYMYENHRASFEAILKKMSERVPGIEQVKAEKTIDGRIILQFKDGAFKDPFISRFVSDGTLKMFAYLILLHDPNKRPLLCIEEPENYLYPDLLYALAEEFRLYAHSHGQIFITSHSPDFVNALNIEEVYWLVKKNGVTAIQRALDDPNIRSLVDAGDKLGYLWMQDYFTDNDPK